MIYQTYHRPEQLDSCFKREPYQPIDLTTIQPDPIIQTQLCEYAAMLRMLERLDLNPDRWIGFTSHAQLMKNTSTFYSAQQVADTIPPSGLLVWGWTKFVDVKEAPVTLMEESEICHEGITRVLMELMWRCGLRLPNQYILESEAPFYNYFACENETFIRYMSWSSQMVRLCIMSIQADTAIGRYVRSHPRAISYVAERLLILWLSLNDVPVRVIEPERTVWVRNSYNPGAT